MKGVCIFLAVCCVALVIAITTFLPDNSKIDEHDRRFLRALLDPEWDVIIMKDEHRGRQEHSFTAYWVVYPDAVTQLFNSSDWRALTPGESAPMARPEWYVKLNTGQPEVWVRHFDYKMKRYEVRAFYSCKDHSGDRNMFLCVNPALE